MTQSSSGAVKSNTTSAPVPAPGVNLAMDGIQHTRRATTPNRATSEATNTTDLTAPLYWPTTRPIDPKKKLHPQAATKN